MLKAFIAAAALLLSNTALAQHGPSYGTHGMALFGGKAALYVSHLPMFHAPHDTQVVARVRLEDQALDAALRTQLDGKTALWTIHPEKFELHRLAPDVANPLARFKADVVAGHFEQGGTTRHAGAAFIVEQVLVYRRLDPAARSSASSVYLPVGTFLVKQIDSRPDFDHIVLMAKPAAAPVKVAKADLREPVLDGALGTIYFSTDDLK